MAAPTIIVDYGTGNLRSVWRGLNRAGAAADVTSDPRQVRAAGKIVLPGVGNFGRAMSGLPRLGLIEALNEAVLDRRVPVLGICLGMELMAISSEEGGRAGLGWIDASVVRFRPADQQRHKVPYIGWNQVAKTRESELLAGLDTSAEYYFLHSYHLELADRASLVAETVYDKPFPSVLETGNIYGVQFHPERSHDVGRRVLQNFLNL